MLWSSMFCGDQPLFNGYMCWLTTCGGFQVMIATSGGCSWATFGGLLLVISHIWRDMWGSATFGGLCVVDMTLLAQLRVWSVELIWCGVESWIYGQLCGTESVNFLNMLTVGYVCICKAWALCICNVFTIAKENLLT